MPLTDQDVEVLDQVLPQPFGALLKAHHAASTPAPLSLSPLPPLTLLNNPEEDEQPC